jgi:hypothetical protein
VKYVVWSIVWSNVWSVGGQTTGRPRADHGQTTGRPRADHGTYCGTSHGTDHGTDHGTSHGTDQGPGWGRIFPWPVPRQAISSCICHENLASLPHPARIASTLHGAHNGCEGTDGALICAFASGIIYSINMAFVIRMTIIVNQ